MNNEAMQLALEALETERPYLGPMPTKTSKAITALREALAEQPAQQEPVALRDALASALTSVYVCGRVWSAWGVGTMSEDDFSPASECDEVLDELVSAVASVAPHPAQQEPSPDGVLFAVEEAIRNGDCPWQIEQAFDDYEAERKAHHNIKEST